MPASSKLTQSLGDNPVGHLSMASIRAVKPPGHRSVARLPSAHIASGRVDHCNQADSTLDRGVDLWHRGMRPIDHARRGCAQGARIAGSPGIGLDVVKKLSQGEIEKLRLFQIERVSRAWE